MWGDLGIEQHGECCERFAKAGVAFFRYAVSTSRHSNSSETLHSLVVEDSTMMRKLIVFALSRVPNLSITEANDGVDGLRKLKTAKFDIIVTDINMPIMDGLKLVHHVRADATHKNVPILVITTERANEDRQRALSLGANAYITKPIQAPMLVGVVRKLLKLAG